MNNTLNVICLSISITMLLIVGTTALNVMAKDNPVGSYKCFPQDDGETVLCCQLFQGDNDDYKWYCSYCDNTSPPSNCSPRFEARNDAGGGVMTPPTGGVSDDPQAGDDRNPSIPSTEGLTDEAENNPNGNEDSSTANTIPKNGGNGFDPSELNGNTITQ